MECTNCENNGHPHSSWVTRDGYCTCCGLRVDWSGLAPRGCGHTAAEHSAIIRRMAHTKGVRDKTFDRLAELTDEELTARIKHFVPL